MVAIPDRELALREGRVPDTIEALRETPHWQIGRDAFRMTLPSGLAFHYRRGDGTVFARCAKVSDDEVSLFFDGSVRGAIAWLGGLVPLHASAVVYDGRVYAFTGVSGEGKSTLTAALAKAGFATFCDDVLVIDPNDALALPGHKRLKLWQDALALTGHAPMGAVRPGMDKFFVAGSAGPDIGALPLRRLYVLGSAGSPAIVPIRGGGERFTELRAAYYRPRFGTALSDPAAYFQMTMRLANTIDLRRFDRSRDPAQFDGGVAAIADDIRGPRVR